MTASKSHSAGNCCTGCTQQLKCFKALSSCVAQHMVAVCQSLTKHCVSDHCLLALTVKGSTIALVQGMQVMLVIWQLYSRICSSCIGDSSSSSDGSSSSRGNSGSIGNGNGSNTIRLECSVKIRQLVSSAATLLRTGAGPQVWASAHGVDERID